MLTLESLTESYITINAHGVPAITLPKKGSTHTFNSQGAYLPYQIPVQALIASGRVKFQEKSKVVLESEKAVKPLEVEPQIEEKSPVESVEPVTQEPPKKPNKPAKKQKPVEPVSE